MKLLRKNHIYLMVGIITLFSCKSGEESNDSLPLNSFNMYVNNQFWEPSIKNGDPCYADIYCNSWAVNQIPVYTIEAKRDSSLKSEYLRLQVRNLIGPGKYYLNDKKGDFTSYVMLVMSQSETEEIYVNSDVNLNSIVEIEEMFSNYKSNEKIAIRGSFNGILYNIRNSNDSIIIKNCRFTFGKINWSGLDMNCHCADCRL